MPPKTTFRFNVGDRVFVIDGNLLDDTDHYKIIQDPFVFDAEDFEVKEAVVREQHSHPDRHPCYPMGEGYALDGDLWWDCYPGFRVWATRAEAEAGKGAVRAAEMELLERKREEALEEIGEDEVEA